MTHELPASVKFDPSGEPQLWQHLARMFDPGERLAVDEWAAKYYRLPPEESVEAGRFDFARTPYMPGPLRALSLPRYERIVLIWGSGTGKTTIGQIFLSYSVDQDPGPMLMMFIDKKFAGTRSKNHLQPIIRANPRIESRLMPRRDALQKFDYAFDRMTINLAWIGSAGAQRGEHVRYLQRDEFAAFTQRDKTDANPMETSANRVRAFDRISKILDYTTPKHKTGNGWLELEQPLDDGSTYNPSTWHECYVPCPHCGKPELMRGVGIPCVIGQLVVDQNVTDLAERLKAAGYQTLELDGFTGGEKTTDETALKASAKYFCKFCRQGFEHSAVGRITQHCVWIPKICDRTVASFRLPSWYRAKSKMSFGAVRVKLVKSKGDPEKLKDVLNSDAALPWEERGIEKSKEDFRVHIRPYPRGVLPFEPVFIFWTFDIRDNEIHGIARAWKSKETSAKLEEVVLLRLQKWTPGSDATGSTLAPIEPLLRKTWTFKDRAFGVSMTGIDSGYDTAEVYAFCRTHSNCVALKGDEATRNIWNISKPEKLSGTNEERPDSCQLIAFQSDYFADALAAKLSITPGRNPIPPAQRTGAAGETDLLINPGEWMLDADTTDEYLTHMVAEKKVSHKTKWGVEKFRWKKFGSAPNHFRDDEKMQVVLARLTNVADMPEPGHGDGLTPARPNHDASPRPTSFMGKDTSNFWKR